jgi:hypothetical protein
MGINTQTYGELFAQGEINWTQLHDALSLIAERSGIWKVSDFPAGTGDTRVFQEIDSDLFADNKDESDEITEGKTQIGYSKTMNLVRRGKSKTISWEANRRNKYPDLSPIWSSLGVTVANRRELDLQHQLTFGTATSYVDKNGKTIDTTVGDGFALFYTAHTLAGSSTTYRNRLANNPAFSAGALEGMLNMTDQNSYTNLGEKVAFNFDIIWSTNDENTVNTIRQELNATADTGAPNKGVPSLYGKGARWRFRHVILDYVPTTAAIANDTTKRKYWGLCDSSNTQLHLAIEERLNVQSPQVASNATDILTEDMIFKATGSYGIVSVSGRGNAFSSGDGAA